MRTTITLDEDVAAQLRRLQREREITFRDVVNQALRAGLRELGRPSRPGGRYRLKTFSVGQLLIENLDNVSEVLAQIEGDAYK